MNPHATYVITSQNTMYCGGEPEASYTKCHIATRVYILIAHKHVSCTCHESNL